MKLSFAFLQIFLRNLTAVRVRVAVRRKSTAAVLVVYLNATKNEVSASRGEKSKCCSTWQRTQSGQRPLLRTRRRYHHTAVWPGVGKRARERPLNLPNRLSLEKSNFVKYFVVPFRENDGFRFAKPRGASDPGGSVLSSQGDGWHPRAAQRRGGHSRFVKSYACPRDRLLAVYPLQ